MDHALFSLISAGIVLVLDTYFFLAFKKVFSNRYGTIKPIWNRLYWSATIIVLLALLIFNLISPAYSKDLRNWVIFLLVADIMSKLLGLPFVIIDDLRRGLFFLIKRPKGTDNASSTKKENISRSQFLSKMAVGTALIPMSSMGFGIISGAYDYHVRKVKLRLPQLPGKFHGLKIAQLSDIHSGSFFNKTAVEGGVDMLLKEKPDMVFFTGDLVNVQTDEVKDYIPIFSKIKAPMGVFSTLGNHDYGDYRRWTSEAQKRSNLDDMLVAHKELGWDLLMNENRLFGSEGDQLAIIGIENWGTGRFPKYGKLDEAYKGAEEANIKLLLSHDPSHWDAQVRKEYKDIDVMFAGHTHGFQFGIEIGGYQWSPAQYRYKQWGGIYEDENQKLYVNRGYGYIGYPGRIGMPPEITIFELEQP